MQGKKEKIQTPHNKPQNKPLRDAIVREPRMIVAARSMTERGHDYD